MLLASVGANYFIKFSLRTMEYNIEQRLISIVEYLADFADAEELDSYQKKEDMELQSYKDLQRKLVSFAEKHDIAQVYFIRPKEDDLQYIIDSDFADSARVLDSKSLTYEKYPKLKDVKDEGKTLCSSLNNYEEDKEGLITAYAPVFGRDGKMKAIAGVDLYDKNIAFARKMVLALTIVQVFSIMLVLSSGVLSLVRFRRECVIAERAQIREKNANATKSKFLATVSHEIRTPMNAIMGITEIEINKDGHSEETQNSFRRIYDSSYMLLHIINDILDLSKIESGKLEIIPVKYDIASLINDTIQLNIMRLGGKQIKFILQVPEDMPAYFIGDDLRIKQILNNLLSNAFKYTNKGSVTLEFKAEPSDEKNGEEVRLTIIVRDTGQGMSAEQVANIFSEYARFNMEANRTVEGTGLGLNITKRLVELMHGNISVESELGVGTVLTVQLLQQAAEDKVIGKEMAENLKNFQFFGLKQMKNAEIVREYMPYGSVLVVDDIETNLFVAKGLLQPYGLKVETVDSGFKVLDKIKEGKVYDIILMDHMMPQMDGMETTKKIREMGYAHPVVALTANAVAGQADIFAQNGFDGFVSKPVDIRQLHVVLNKMIRDKQSPEVIEAARQQQKVATLKSTSVPKNAIQTIFARDAKKALPIFENIFKDTVTDEDLRLFVINAHAMKSALANIGEQKASKQAALLEKIGKEQDKNAIQTETQSFVVLLKSIVERIDAENVEVSADEDPAYLHEQLQIIGKACTDYDEQTADAALANLQKMQWTKETKELLEQISEHLLFSDFEAAREKILCFPN
jgi:signal transduction histidine kinase/CheY-like chemotaxis protein/HPt (histidine-containing phosphotransfer) domain-containing protein